MKIERCTDLNFKGIKEFEKDFSSLPDDVIVKIFSKLSLGDFFRGSHISPKIQRALNQDHVTRLSLETEQFSPQELRLFLKRCPNIEWINLYNTGTDEHLHVIIDADLSNLKTLFACDNPNLTTKGLGPFFKKYHSTLENVCIMATKVGDGDLKLLAEARHLKSINFTGCDLLENAGISFLFDRCQSTLETINVCSIKIRDSAYTKLLGASKLKTLVLNSQDLGAGFTAMLQSLTTTIQFVSLRNSNLQDHQLKVLAEAQKLTTLILDGCQYITSQGFTPVFAECNSIRKVSVAGTKIQNSNLKELADLPNLEILDISFCSDLSSEGFVPLFLKRKSSLIQLNLKGTHVTADDLEKLEGALNLRELTLSSCKNLSSKDFISLLSLFQRTIKTLQRIAIDSADINATLAQVNPKAVVP